MSPAENAKFINRWVGCIKRAQKLAEQAEADALEYVIPELRGFTHSLLQDRRFEARFSGKYLEQKLTRLAEQSVVTEPAVTSGLAEATIRSLREFDERKVCLACLDGVQIDQLPVALGPFTIRSGNDEAGILRLEECIRRAVAELRYTDDEKAVWVETLSASLRGGLKNRYYAEVEILAEPQKAYEIFIVMVRALIDILQFAASCLSFHGGVRVSLDGDGLGSVHAAWVLPLYGGGFKQPNEWKGSSGELTLDEATLAAMQRCGATQMCGMLSRATSEIEDAILRAAHWCAEAVRQRTPDNELLCLNIAIEALFAGRSGPIKHLIAEGVAFLTGRDGTERMAIYRMVSRAYSIRSEIVHEGHGSSGDTAKVLRDLRCIVRNCISKMVELSASVKTREELHSWIARKRFDG